MRLCRFDAGAGGYLARETETETGARRHGHADGRAAALASTRGTHGTLGHNPHAPADRPRQAGPKRRLTTFCSGSALCICLYPTGCYGIDERGVVALILIGIGLGKGSDCTVEDLGGAEVAGDLDRVAGSRVGAGQRPRAQSGVEGQIGCPASRRCRLRSSSPRS